jgi:dCTP deaminase
MLKNDRWINEQAASGMIEPFQPTLVRHLEPETASAPVLSYGCSSYGYDLRLSAREFLIFRHVPGTVMNPKRFNPANLEPAPLHHDEDGQYFILPAHSYGLGVALERLRVPPTITVICLGKSTYARLGIIVNTTPAEACLSGDSEVLCRTGWKPVSDVIIGEDVMCLENGAAVYQPIQQFHRYYFNGDMLSFKSKKISQLVTPAHKMWASFVKKRVESGSSYPGGRLRGVHRKSLPVFDFERMAAESVFGKHNLYLSREVNWVGSRIGPTVRIGERDYPVDAWLKFLGCWLGDGSAYAAKRGNYIIKLAVVTKEKKRAYFRDVLAALGVVFNESKYGFSFQHKETCLYLMQYKGAYDKRIPREYTTLPPDQLALLREGMMNSDGCLATSTYTSVSKRLADDFQEICIKIGDYATMWQKQNTINGRTFSSYLCRFSLRNTSPSKMLPKNCSKVPYAGFVYDLTVPSHVFLMRHNGRASWTGNSWEGHLTLEFSNSSGADCRIYAEEGICQLLFFEGDPCDTTYAQRQGKYQGQPERVTLARV